MEKPKKVLSKEQLAKMQEGRKKAYEKRKQERESAKQSAKQFDNAKKKNNKEELLRLEMEALQQQQDRINNLKLQVERKKEIKSKLKQPKMTIEPISEEEEEYKEEIVDEVSEELEMIEEKVEKKLDHKREVSNEEYSKVFNEQAKLMRNKIPKETRTYYDDAVSKFDFTLSLDDNIKNMINHVKDVVDKNTHLVKEVRHKQIEKEDQQEIVQKSQPETLVETHIESQIHKLMKMRY